MQTLVNRRLSAEACLVGTEKAKSPVPAALTALGSLVAFKPLASALVDASRKAATSFLQRLRQDGFGLGNSQGEKQAQQTQTSACPPVPSWLCACACVCVRARACVCMCACVPVCLCACVPVYLCASLSLSLSLCRSLPSFLPLGKGL